eukprot:1439257-Amphidinium_carterae.1
MERERALGRKGRALAEAIDLLHSSPERSVLSVARLDIGSESARRNDRAPHTSLRTEPWMPNVMTM